MHVVILITVNTHKHSGYGKAVDLSHKSLVSLQRLFKINYIYNLISTTDNFVRTFEATHGSN